MVQNRYFYYLLLLNGLINIINFVPRILVEYRFHGALASIVLSVLIGMGLLYFTVKLYAQFPEQGLPELLDETIKPVFRKVYLFLLSLLWFIAGAITLISFVDITIKYISPDLPSYVMLTGFLLVVCLFSRLRAESIMYALEMFLLMLIPIIVYILAKSLLSPHISWDAIIQIGTYSLSVPRFEPIAAGSFIFSGYTNIVIFNRIFGPIKLKYGWAVSIGGLFILLTTFLIPIGYHGTQGVTRHIYPWFSTADSIQITLFIVERMLYVFYFVYITLSLVSSIVHWHVALELNKSIFQRQNSNKEKLNNWIEGLCLTGFIGITYAMSLLSQEQTIQLATQFLKIRFVAEIIVLFITVYIVKRRLRI